MGFLSRLVGRKNQKEIIEFEKLDSILTEQIEKLKSMPFFEPLIKEMLKGKEAIEKDIEALKSADVAGIEASVAASASNAREQLVSKLQNSISSISVPESFEKLNDISEHAFYVLKLSQETGQKVSDYLNFAFEKQMKKLSESLKMMEKPVLQITSELKNRNFKIAELKIGFDVLRSYNDTLREKELIQKEINHLTSEINEKTKLIAEKKREIEYVKQSNSYAEYTNKKKELEEVIEKKKELINSFSSDVSSLEKPFKKYVNGLEKNHPYVAFINRFLEKYLENLSLSDFVNILGQVKTMIEKEDMELKGKQREKALKTIESLSLSYLNEVMGKYNDLEQKRVVLESFILSSEMEKDLNRILNEIANLESDIKTHTSDVNAKTDELGMKENILVQKKAKIKEVLEKNVGLTF